MHTPARARAKTESQAEGSILARGLGRAALDYVHTAEIGGAVLLIAAVAALVWANSPWRQSYHDFFHTPITIQFGSFELATPDQAGHAEGDGHAAGMTLHHWINDALMVVFFFLVGLEIKRELVDGELRGMRRAALPVVIALGGMIAPALLYLGLNVGGPGARGWGVPMATDIAFALGALALLGDRVGGSIRVLLLAFAIADDIGAILVIALFYSSSISWVSLGVAAGMVFLVIAMQRLGVLDVGPYLFVGILLWAALLASGVHATIAGVVLGLMTPATPWFPIERYRKVLSRLDRELQAAIDEGRVDDAEYVLGRIEQLTAGTEPVLDRLIRDVHPWSAFFVLPVFALANAGVTLDGEVVSGALRSAVFWGIVLGLVVGKPIGTTGLAWLASRAGLVTLPEDVSWRQLFGIGLLGGIGFTVALFIAELAFDDLVLVDQAKIAILTASLISAVAGFVYLWRTPSRRGAS